MRHVKTDKWQVIDHQIEVYRHFSNIPTNIVRIASDKLEYDWVDGTHNEDWKSIWLCMKWQSASEPTYEDRRAYVHYVLDRCPSNLWQCVYPALMPIITDKLHGVVMPHGDLTFSNVIGSTIIDPGNSRGLNCREIDEAKLMQSLDGWKDKFGPHHVPIQKRAVNARMVHIALLVSHYVRMLPYGCAVKGRIKSISDWINQTSNYHTGRGWLHLQASRSGPGYSMAIEYSPAGSAQSL